MNNAGFGTSGDFHPLDPERMGQEISLNVLALTLISRAALGVMVPAGRGYLLNVSSVAGFQPARKLAVYAATKAYVTSLSESLHEEVRGTGVHVTALCPGLTRTEFQSVSRTEEYTTQYPSMAWMSATDVAAAGLRDVACGTRSRYRERSTRHWPPCSALLRGLWQEGSPASSSVKPRDVGVA